jgi:UDP-glucuronate 4-epimerase
MADTDMRAPDDSILPHALVTGAAGFIGSHLVDRLLAEGWRVTAVDNFDPFSPASVKRGNIAAHRECDRYKLLELDIRDAGGLDSELDGKYDVIAHLAAKAGVRPSIADPISDQEVNVRGTHNMLELCRR